MQSFLTSAFVTRGGVNEGTARTQEGWEEGEQVEEAHWLFRCESWTEDYGEEREGSWASPF